MNKKPFEQCINQLLDQAAYSDTLRSIANASQSSSALAETLDNMLLEEEIAAQFDFRGYDVLETQTRVLKKLRFLHDYLVTQGVPDTNKDLIIIGLCYAYVSKNYALTAEIVINLNDIYKRYGGKRNN